jgi:hypothetical protein
VTASLELASFGLPDSFPPERVPAPLVQFVAATVPGPSKAQLHARMRTLDWRPIWKRMPTFDTENVKAY